MTELEQRIFDDLAPRAAFAKAIDKSERTVSRLGLPTVYVGRDPYIIVSKAKAQLLGGGSEKPKRGRPRKAA